MIHDVYTFGVHACIVIMSLEDVMNMLTVSAAISVSFTCTIAKGNIINGHQHVVVREYRKVIRTTIAGKQVVYKLIGEHTPTVGEYQAYRKTIEKVRTDCFYKHSVEFYPELHWKHGSLIEDCSGMGV